MELKNKKEGSTDLLLINPLWTKKMPLPRNLFELGSFLIDNGYNPKLCDLNVILSELKSDYIEKSIEIIKSYHCKILCFALSVNTVPFVFELINKIKKDREFITIVGGLFATSNPKLVFDNCDVGYVIIGEGSFSKSRLEYRYDSNTYSELEMNPKSLL